MKNLRLVSISKRLRNLGKALGQGLGLLKNECANNIIFLNFRKDRRKDVKMEFFMRFRRTYVLKTT